MLCRGYHKHQWDISGIDNQRCWWFEADTESKIVCLNQTQSGQERALPLRGININKSVLIVTAGAGRGKHSFMLECVPFCGVPLSRTFSEALLFNKRTR